MPYRVFELEEVAQYLHLQSGDVERLVKNQDIPFERRGNRIVFRKVEIQTWASRRILGLEGRRLADYFDKSAGDADNISSKRALLPQLLRQDFIEAALPAKTKASVLKEMAALAAKTGRVADATELRRGLEAREALCSTGLPGGMALLHPRYHDPDLFESSFIVLGRTTQEIPFGSPDGQPSTLFFLLGCTDDRLHLHTMARLCLMTQKTDLLVSLQQASGQADMYDSIIAAEQAILPQR